MVIEGVSAQGSRAWGLLHLSPVVPGTTTSMSPRACAASISALLAASYGFQSREPMKDHCACAWGGGCVGTGGGGGSLDCSADCCAGGSRLMCRGYWPWSRLYCRWSAKMILYLPAVWSRGISGLHDRQEGACAGEGDFRHLDAIWS